MNRIYDLGFKIYEYFYYSLFLEGHFGLAPQIFRYTIETTSIFKQISPSEVETRHGASLRRFLDFIQYLGYFLLILANPESSGYLST